MKMYHKIILSLFIILGAFIPYKDTQANDNVEIMFFGSPTCPHCISQQSFFKDLKEEYNELSINEYIFSESTDLVQEKYEEYNVPANQRGLVPISFMDDGETFFLGFNEDIEQSIINYIEGIQSEQTNSINIPFYGEVDLYSLSLPILAITLGIVDGFNVCSLGALVIILSLVMVLRSRKRIILLGGTFILITGLTYGILMLLWHQLFTFISPFIKSMEILLAIISLIAGFYLFREFIKSYKEGPACSSGGILARLSPKVEKIFSTKKNIALLVGVVGLFALAVTIIEFPCSALLPMVFTGILVEAGLPMSASISYIALFILFYMLDEVIIFLIAALTMRLKIVSPRFIIFFNLLAAVIFIFLGIFYLNRVL